MRIWTITIVEQLVKLSIFGDKISYTTINVLEFSFSDIKNNFKLINSRKFSF